MITSPGASELKELAGGGENDERHLGVAQHGELLRLLEQPPAPLRERHLPRRCVLYLLYLYLLPRHQQSNCSCKIHPKNNDESISTHKRQQHRLRFSCVIMENKKHVGFQIKRITIRDSNPNMEKYTKRRRRR